MMILHILDQQMLGSKKALIRLYLRVPQSAGQVKI